uniref:Retrotransposon gag domain-containing protein n=1 Tax=Brassica oleracea TaxID=3712 RepID=A0A3P6DAV7_BRAOL|nr:unnamed protein product [Brassica oleracea]
MHSLNTSIDADDEAQRPVPTDEEPAAGTSAARSTQVHDDKDSDSEMENEDGAPEGVTTSQTTITAYLEKMFSKKFDAIQSMGERLPGVASPSPIQRSDPNSYANTPFVDAITLVEMPPKFSFPNQQEPGEEFDDLYEILQHRAEPIRTYIARFNHEEVAIPECNAVTAISAFKRGMIPDGYLYKELTKYQCKSMKNILSRACGQVKREEDVASWAKAQ